MLSTVEVAVSKPVAQPWSHLPNAALIDLILADLRARSAVWVDARPPSRYSEAKAAARDAAWDAAWAAARAAALTAADAATVYAVMATGAATSSSLWRSAAWPARDAVLTLIAWDDCGYLLSTDPEQVKVLALLGHHPSVLLHPASLALHNHKEAV